MKPSDAARSEFEKAALAMCKALKVEPKTYGQAINAATALNQLKAVGILPAKLSDEQKVKALEILYLAGNSSAMRQAIESEKTVKQGTVDAALMGLV